jgi:hypothetical protein
VGRKAGKTDNTEDTKENTEDTEKIIDPEYNFISDPVSQWNLMGIFVKMFGVCPNIRR